MVNERALDNTQSFEGQIEDELRLLANVVNTLETTRSYRASKIEEALAPLADWITVADKDIASLNSEIGNSRARLLDLGKSQFESGGGKTTLTAAGKLTLKAPDKLQVDDEEQLKALIREHKMGTKLIAEQLIGREVIKWIRWIDTTETGIIIGTDDIPIAHLEPDYSIAVEFPKESVPEA